MCAVVRGQDGVHPTAHVWSLNNRIWAATNLWLLSEPVGFSSLRTTSIVPRGPGPRNATPGIYRLASQLASLGLNAAGYSALNAIAKRAMTEPTRSGPNSAGGTSLPLLGLGRARKTRKSRKQLSRRQIVTGPDAMGAMRLGASEVGTGRLPSGSKTVIWEFSQINTTISSDGTGKSSAKIVLTNALFTRMTQLLAMYDRCRLKSLRAILWPVQGSATAGQTIAYVDYRGSDAAATTLAAASLMQGAKVCSVWQPLTLEWKPQDAIDTQFIDTAQTVNFHNDGKGHAICVVVEGAPTATLLYQVYLVGRVEYTARI